MTRFAVYFGVMCTLLSGCLALVWACAWVLFTFGPLIAVPGVVVVLALICATMLVLVDKSKPKIIQAPMTVSVEDTAAFRRSKPLPSRPGKLG